MEGQMPATVHPTNGHGCCDINVDSLIETALVERNEILK